MQTAKVMIALLVGALMFGCGQPHKVHVVPSQSTRNDSSMNDKDFKSLVSRANNLFTQGRDQLALQMYEQVVTEYESENERFELAILTNASLAALKSGDRDKFLYLSDKIQNRCADLQTIQTNTQLVLLIAQELGDSKAARDMRIHSQLYEAVHQAMKIQ